MIPVVALTNQDIKKIADCLFGQIEVEDSSDQQLSTTFSASNAEVDITAMFFCGSVTVDSYKAIDEDSKKHPHYTEEEAGVLDERKVSHWLKAD